MTKHQLLETTSPPPSPSQESPNPAEEKEAGGRSPIGDGGEGLEEVLAEEAGQQAEAEAEAEAAEPGPYEIPPEGCMGYEEFHGFFCQSHVLVGSLLQLQSLAGIEGNAAVAPGTWALYQYAIDYEWMRWLIKRHGEHWQRLGAIAFMGATLYGPAAKEWSDRMAKKKAEKEAEQEAKRPGQARPVGGDQAKADQAGKSDQADPPPEADRRDYEEVFPA